MLVHIAFILETDKSELSSLNLDAAIKTKERVYVSYTVKTPSTCDFIWTDILYKRCV